MSERSQNHNPAAHSRSWPICAKRGGPSLTHRPHPTTNPTISFASVPRQRWVPNRGKQTAAPLSLKRGTDESGAFHRKSSQCMQIFPSRTSRACSLPKQKTQRLWVSNNEDEDPHTILNVLLVLAMIERKPYSYQNARFKQKQSVKTKKRMMCPPGIPYIAVAWHHGLSPANKWCFYIVCFRHGSCWQCSP